MLTLNNCWNEGSRMRSCSLFVMIYEEYNGSWRCFRRVRDIKQYAFGELNLLTTFSLPPPHTTTHCRILEAKAATISFVGQLLSLPAHWEKETSPFILYETNEKQQSPFLGTVKVTLPNILHSRVTSWAVFIALR